MTYPLYMRDLYSRLRELGFDAKFIRARVLPDWWDDSLASEPTNRALAEAAVSRMLGFPIADLRKPDAKLRLPSTNHVRLKRRQDTTDREVAPTILVAERAASAIVSSLVAVPPFAGEATASSVRGIILQSRRLVDLESLLDFAWRHGIAVLHVSGMPSASKRFSGMALFCNSMPVVVLASRSDSPPWIAFHLAHELGHILLGHVTLGREGLADVDIDRTAKDEQEREANAFACEVLAGISNPHPGPVYGLTGERLAVLARHEGLRSGSDPGAIALIYGRNADRMPAAQNAIKLMGMDKGAHSIIARFLRQHLSDAPSDLAIRFLALANAA